MDPETAKKIVKPQLTDKRYEHSIRVTDMAVELAQQYGADTKKAELAGILHDYAKFRPLEEMKTLIESDNNIKKDLIHYGEALWHAPVGAYLLQTEAGMNDDDILSAVAYHTTAKANMTTLEKVIFLADYIEPGRAFPGVDDVRELAKKNLDAAIAEALSNTIQFLLKQKQKVYPETIDAYNMYVRLTNS